MTRPDTRPRIVIPPPPIEGACPVKEAQGEFCQLWKQCLKSEGAACSSLAERYHYGMFVPVDIKKATALYTWACEQKEGKACFWLMLLHQEKKSASIEKRKEILLRSCDLKWAPACNHVGLMLDQGGSGFTRDPIKALQFFKKACSYGAGESCLQLGTMLKDGFPPIRKDVEKARNFLQLACKLKNATGCAFAGEFVISEQTNPERFEQALPLLESACKEKEPRGCAWIGEFYRVGKAGLSRNPKQALPLSQQACLAKIARGCYNEGFFHYQGLAGVRRNVKTAIAKWQEACSLGSTEACLQMLSLHKRGVAGLSRKPRALIPFLRAICSSKQEERCFELAQLLRRLGDIVGARDYLWISCSRKYKKSCELFKKLPKPKASPVISLQPGKLPPGAPLPPQPPPVPRSIPNPNAGTPETPKEK